jgi:hypothetical protein
LLGIYRKIICFLSILFSVMEITNLLFVLSFENLQFFSTITLIL